MYTKDTAKTTFRITIISAHLLPTKSAPSSSIWIEVTTVNLCNESESDLVKEIFKHQSSSTSTSNDNSNKFYQDIPSDLKNWSNATYINCKEEFL